MKRDVNWRIEAYERAAWRLGHFLISPRGKALPLETKRCIAWKAYYCKLVSVWWWNGSRK